MNWDDLNREKNFQPFEAYQQSKLANVLFSLELSKRFKDDGITCNKKKYIIRYAIYFFLTIYLT